jgi:hypothetical protein
MPAAIVVRAKVLVGAAAGQDVVEYGLLIATIALVVLISIVPFGAR